MRAREDLIVWTTTRKNDKSKEWGGERMCLSRRRRRRFAFKFQSSFAPAMAVILDSTILIPSHKLLLHSPNDDDESEQHLVSHIKNSEFFSVGVVVTEFCVLISLSSTGFTVGLWLKWIWNFFIVLVLCMPAMLLLGRKEQYFFLWLCKFRTSHLSQFRRGRAERERRQDGEKFIIIIFHNSLASLRHNSFLSNNFMARVSHIPRDDDDASTQLVCFVSIFCEMS